MDAGLAGVQICSSRVQRPLCFRVHLLVAIATPSNASHYRRLFSIFFFSQIHKQSRPSSILAHTRSFPAIMLLDTPPGFILTYELTSVSRQLVPSRFAEDVSSDSSAIDRSIDRFWSNGTRIRWVNTTLVTQVRTRRREQERKKKKCGNNHEAIR